jgi:UDP:flavonoid glycosyltransferase YjiC (YdhE family)
LYPEPIGSNMIYTGSICSDAKPLPPDLLQFVSDPNSKGTIYAALGSYVHWDYAPKHVLKAFVDAVNELSEYRIIWGFQGTHPTNIGKHVKMFDWAPQNDILHHEKTVLFISHGGLKRYQLDYKFYFSSVKF